MNEEKEKYKYLQARSIIGFNDFPAEILLKILFQLVKKSAFKMLKVAKDLKAKLRKIIRGNSRPINDSKVISSQLENLPTEILLKIFHYMNPKIKELLLLSQVSRRVRSIAQDHSLWQNVNLFPRRIVPAGLIQLILQNGCKRINTRSQIVGTLKLNKETQLEFLNSWNTNSSVLTVLLSSCHSLQQLRLSNVILNHEMISSICYQNGQTLKVLKLAHCNFFSNKTIDDVWIRLIIDNCVELSVLDLIDTQLSEESIEYIANNLTPKISKLWLTSGIESRDKCMQMIKMLENRCKNLTELKLTMLRRCRSSPGSSYGSSCIGSQSYQEEQKDLKKLEDFISTFRRYE